MPRALRSIFFLALALALALTATTANRADLVTSLSVTVTHEANGLYRYDYILSVGAKSTAGASNFNMTVDPAAALIFGAASAPSGWDVSYMAGDPAVMFSSPDPTLDIAPGATGKFEFESRLGGRSRTTPYSAQFCYTSLPQADLWFRGAERMSEPVVH